MDEHNVLKKLPYIFLQLLSKKYYLFTFFNHLLYDKGKHCKKCITL